MTLLSPACLSLRLAIDTCDQSFTGKMRAMPGARKNAHEAHRPMGVHISWSYTAIRRLKGAPPAGRGSGDDGSIIPQE